MKNHLIRIAAAALLLISTTLPSEAAEPSLSGDEITDNYIFVTPNGSGNYSGSSWDNALSDKDLSDMLGKSEGNITVFMEGGKYQSLKFKNTNLESLSIFGSIGGKKTFFGNGTGYGCKIKTSNSCITDIYQATARGNWYFTNTTIYDIKVSDTYTHLFVSPEGSGSKDGTSFDNALPQSELATALDKSKGYVYIFMASGTYKPFDLQLNSDITTLRIFGNFGGESSIQSEGRDFSSTVFTVRSDRPDSEKKVDVHLKNIAVYGQMDFGNTDKRTEDIKVQVTEHSYQNLTR